MALPKESVTRLEVAQAPGDAVLPALTAAMALVDAVRPGLEPVERLRLAHEVTGDLLNRLTS